MSPLTERLAEEALTLPDAERAALVELLLQSLGPGIDEELDRLWAEEAEGRVQEIEDGTVTLLDGQEVLQEIRQRLRR